MLKLMVEDDDSEPEEDLESLDPQQTDCLALGGNLASIKSTTEYDFIRQLVRTAAGKDLEFWVGGHDAVMEGVWLWSDGFKFNFKSWGKGEPNNHGGKEHCMEINFGGTK
ncbi:hypothetical protein F7725_023453 [Dissostichus mawsoni]|uniref:C-type lectin domain-containing protein n=1 Tax=Dissostichus mawsoni TaxID=36200 RepID=A0A7J5Z521_DISMA|nr:hypothetical protein F7725_023453 [Dissostichus mawsoni]